MLSIGKLTAGREEYYLSCLAAGGDEYYLAPGEQPGVWLGSASPVLGLDGTVDPDDFRSVLAGIDPRTGEEVVARPGNRRRITGFDLTFSSPKSVSVLWALAPPELSAMVADAHDRAVAETMTAFEADVVRARRGHGGLRQVETDGVVAAGFVHRTSRAGDPHLHTHVVVANLTVDGDGRWSAPDGRRIYGWAKTLGFMYQASLRHQLSETLGLDWGPVRNGAADLAGVAPELLAVFSQRRADIVAELDRLGYDSPAAARVATLATRPAKEPATSRDQLRERWAERAATIEPPDLAALVGRGMPQPPEPGHLIEDLLSPDGLTRSRSSFDRRDILQALAAGHPAGSPISALRDVADRLLDNQTVVTLAVETPVGGPRYSTVELLTIEARIVDGPVRRAGQHVGMVPVTTLERALSERPSLADEQRAMVAQLTRSGAGVEVVVGRAGAGKTYALDAARAAWQSAGLPVIGTALAARAAAELESGAGIPATTIDRLLIDLDRPGPLGGLAPGTVLVVDEAGMVGTRKLARLLDAAERDRAKVVLVGDPRQLPEIDTGGAFAALSKQSTVIELVDNRRQHQVWEREALSELRSGSVLKAVAAFHQEGRINLAPTADAARDALVNDWWAARQTGVEAAMYALRRSDVDDLNRRARHHLRAAGLLGEESIRVAGRELAVGDEIICLRNDRRLGVRNGTTATITGIAAHLEAITVAVDRDTSLTLPTDYLQAGHVGYGYATTVHKSQGVTVDRAFLLGSDALYREAGYVGLSRARHGSDLYLVAGDPESPRFGVDIALSPTMNLVRQLQASRAQEMALDQLHPHLETGLEL